MKYATTVVEERRTSIQEQQEPDDKQQQETEQCSKNAELGENKSKIVLRSKSLHLERAEPRDVPTWNKLFGRKEEERREEEEEYVQPRQTYHRRFGVAFWPIVVLSKG